MYFIANWKMFGDIKSLNSLNKVLKFSRHKKNNKFRLIYCPPYTLLNLFHKKFKNSNKDISKEEVKDAHLNNIQVAVWNTNTEKKNIEAINKNPDFIQTDRVKHLVNILN